MGYLHIDNLYKDQRILMFKECWALEKIHGTSANVSWKHGAVRFHNGGEARDRFLSLFDETKLKELFLLLGHEDVTLYGEAYGGKQQAQSWRYGPDLKFVVFDVKVSDTWLDVPNAHDVSTKMGLEFVHYVKVSTDVPSLDAERDAPSAQAKRNRVEGDKPREGVVLRPITELEDNRGNRIICKHKRDDERETSTPRKVVDPEKMLVLRKAQEIADEWVTTTRLEHVLDKIGPDANIDRTREVISAMVDDILREGAGEIVDSRDARVAISKKTAEMFKIKLRAQIGSQQ